jgi:preprotein translocase subunit SecD
VARNASRPGRTLIVFGIVVAALYGAVALGGTWKPRLGLDLQGGTRITLEASTATGEQVTPAKLEEARGIIDRRVNASGVSEAEVATQGDRNIIVEIPGQNRKDLVDTVKQTAQLRFRIVAAAAPGTAVPEPSQGPSPSGGSSPGASPSGGDSAPASPGSDTSPSASPRGRALSSGITAADQTSEDSGAGQDATGPSPSVAPSPAPGPGPSDDQAGGAPVDQPLAWSLNPGQEWSSRFQDFTCPEGGQTSTPVRDVKDQPLITCGEDGNKYLLSASMIEGTQLTDASAGVPQGQVQWVVDLSFDGTARETFAQVTRQLAGTGRQFAIVLDGTVISAPTVSQPILGGSAQISGNFSEQEAQSLANSLKYGALPLKFTAPVVSEEGPTLAADQLAAGIWAGVIGLGLVLVYCLIYYRGLGLVVFASLMMAAAITYAVVLAMSQSIGFTLTLPGIAGLIVAVGITADSFVVYFERIRDEMREGKSMRLAVEAGWVRARTTCLAADTVSLLAAVVLYIFAIGVVKGFAFALGISTVIDVIVFFFFTKPMVSWLAQFRFFNAGHKLSGLDAENIGLDRLPGVRRPTSVRGEA